jgi:hypothetical protein
MRVAKSSDQVRSSTASYSAACPPIDKIELHLEVEGKPLTTGLERMRDERFNVVEYLKRTGIGWVRWHGG